jgi:hypothetical protein
MPVISVKKILLSSSQTCALPLVGIALSLKVMLRWLSASSTHCSPGGVSKEGQYEERSRLL